MPRKRAILLIAIIPLTLTAVTEVLAGDGYGWLFLGMGLVVLLLFVLSMTVWRPELRLTDATVTFAMPVGRPRTYNFRRCGEFRAFSYFGMPPRCVTFHNAESNDFFGRDPELKRRFIPENASIQSMFDLSAKELAALLNEYRARALAMPQPSL